MKKKTEDLDHMRDCGFWYDEACDCLAYERWSDRYGEPPVRRSKSAKPKHGVSGRSVFVLWDKIRRK